MLQRVQTLFLAVVVLAMGFFLGAPLWDKIAADGVQQVYLTAFQLVHQINEVQSEIQSVFYLALLAIAVAGVALFAITRFRNRLLQSALCAVNSILMTALLGITVYQTFYKAAAYFEPQTPGSYRLGFYALIVAMLSNVMANRFIRRDERIVKESNRMR